MHEIGLWATTLATLVGFALALGFNPALYGATADMLARGTNAMPRLCAMVAGLWLGATVLYIVFQFFNPTSFVSMLRDDVDKALFNRTVDLVAGIILIVSGAIIGFTTLPIMFLTGRVTAALSPHLFPRVVAFAVFLIALGAPFFLLALIWYRFPRISGKVTASYEKVLHWEYRWFVAALLLVFGIFLIVFSMIPHQ